MKNVSKSKTKFFLCFRPVVDIDVMLDSTHHRSSPHKLSPKPKLSRLLKAMLFETILNRRDRRKNRYRQGSCGSSSGYSTYTEETSSTCDDKSICSQISVDTSHNIVQEINPEESQVSTQESKYLTKSKSCPVEMKHKKTSQKKKKQRNKLDFSGIYVFLLGLTLTVFLGKILGVILTSVSLYSFSLWNSRNRKAKEVLKITNTESRIYNHRHRDQKGRLLQ